MPPLSVPYPGIRFSPPGQPIVVNITGASSVSAYTDPYGVTRVVLPFTTSTPRTLYVAGEGPWLVSVKAGGVELAGYTITLEGSQIATANLASTILPTTGIFSSATAGSTFTLNPVNGSGQTITLAPGSSADPYVSNTCVITVATGAQFSMDLIVRQDVVGGRYAAWTNVVWVDNKVPALNQLPNGTTAIRLWSPDAVTVYGQAADSGPFPGVDPFTVPGVVNLTEAWIQPYTTGTTMANSLLARLGPTLTKVTNPFKLTTYATSGTLLGPFEINRASIDGSGTTQDGDGTFNTLANVGFTVIVSLVYGGAGAGDDPIVHNYNASSQGQVNLSVANTGGGNFYVISGTNSGNLFSNYGFVPVVGAAYVCTLIVPASGGNGIFRLNGINQPVLSGTNPWGQTLAMANMRINKGAQSSFATSTGLNKYGSIIGASTPLPYANAYDPIPLMERWAGMQLGVIL